MQIVKPYGRSHAERGADRKLRRVVSLTPDPARGVAPNNRADVEKFAHSHDSLVIAQWISAIDKIASKPAGDMAPTAEQRRFRQRLGEAAWALIEARGLLPGLKEAALKDRLRKLWDFKIAPYSSNDYRPLAGRRPPNAKGRWFARFADGVADVANTDAAKIAERIHEHLYVAQYQMRADQQIRKDGLLAARAKSIAENVFDEARLSGRRVNEIGWSDADLAAYGQAGDVAREIRDAAQRRERGEGETA